MADVLATDGVVEWPFAVPGAPQRLEGSMAFREFLGKSIASNLLHLEDLRVLAIHDTTDPEVIIVESVTCGIVVADGHPCELPSVAVLRVRHGKILSWRDYVNPLAAAKATGTLPTLFAALASQETS